MNDYQWEWELNSLDDINPFVPGPSSLPNQVDEFWDMHGGQGEPGTRIYRFTELRAHYADDELLKIPEVARLVEAIYNHG